MEELVETASLNGLGIRIGLNGQKMMVERRVEEL